MQLAPRDDVMDRPLARIVGHQPRGIQPHCRPKHIGLFPARQVKRFHGGLEVFDRHGNPVGAGPIGALSWSTGPPEIALECRESLMDGAQLVFQVVREDGCARRDLVRQVAHLDRGWARPRFPTFGATTVSATVVQRAAQHDLVALLDAP